MAMIFINIGISKSPFIMVILSVCLQRRLNSMPNERLVMEFIHFVIKKCFRRFSEAANFLLASKYLLASELAISSFWRQAMRNKETDRKHKD